MMPLNGLCLLRWNQFAESVDWSAVSALDKHRFIEFCVVAYRASLDVPDRVRGLLIDLGCADELISEFCGMARTVEITLFTAMLLDEDKDTLYAV